MDILSAILEILEGLHVGKENAIKREDLLRRLTSRPDFPAVADADRAMRKAIEMSGRILTSEKGYYLPADPVSDPRDAIRYLKKKNKGLFEHIARIEKEYPHAGQGGQQELPF